MLVTAQQSLTGLVPMGPPCSPPPFASPFQTQARAPCPAVTHLPTPSILPAAVFMPHVSPAPGASWQQGGGCRGPPMPSVPPHCCNSASLVASLAAVSYGDGRFPPGQAEEERGQPQHFSGGDFIARSALFTLFSGGLVWEGAACVRDVMPQLEFLPRHFFEKMLFLVFDNKRTRQTSQHVSSVSP